MQIPPKSRNHRDEVPAGRISVGILTAGAELGAGIPEGVAEFPPWVEMLIGVWEREGVPKQN